MARRVRVLALFCFYYCARHRARGRKLTGLEFAAAPVGAHEALCRGVVFTVERSGIAQRGLPEAHVVEVGPGATYPRVVAGLEEGRVVTDQSLVVRCRAVDPAEEQDAWCVHVVP